MSLKPITKKLIEELVKTERALQVFYLEQDYYEEASEIPETVAAPPASNKEIATLESHLRGKGLVMPPSYRSFFTVCDGIKNFVALGDLHLLSIAEVMTPPRKNHILRYASLSRFNIARSSETLEFIAFDPETVKAGEMEVVWVAANGEESRDPDFSTFLHGYLKTLQRNLKLEQVSSKKKRK